MKSVYFLTITIFFFMAVRCKKDSVIPFSSDLQCQVNNYDSMIYVQNGDVSELQFDLTEINSVNLISNGTFADDSGWTMDDPQWVIGAGKATFDGSGSSKNLSRVVNEQIMQAYYLLEFDLSTPAGTNIEMDVVLGGQNIGIISGGFINTQHIRMFAFIESPDVNNILLFSGTIGDYSIDNVELFLMSAIQIQIKNCETDEIVDTIVYDDDMFTYFESENFTLTETENPSENYSGWVQVEIDWTTLNILEGCYYICVQDAGLLGVNLIENGRFDVDDPWTFNNTSDGGWSITGGEATHEIGTVGGNDYLVQDLAVSPDPAKTYVLQFTVLNDTGINQQFDFLIDSIETGANFLLGSVIIDVDFTGQILFTGKTITKIQVRAYRSVDAGIDNISIREYSEALTCECTSNRCISYRHSHDETYPDLCNILIEASLENDAHGFYNDFGIVHRVRVFGLIRNPKYDFPNEELQLKSNGVHRLASAHRVKAKELRLMPMPEGIHDAISMMLICHNVSLKIGTTTSDIVKKPGSITPISYEDYDDYGLIVDIMPKTQDNFVYLGS